VILPLRIHLLGDFLLVSGETPVTTVSVPRLQSLLAYFVLHRTAPQARSHLFPAWRPGRCAARLPHLCHGHGARTGLRAE